MLQDIAFILWLALPAALANMAPVFARHWRWLEWANKPIDGGKEWNNKRILGDHKTWRGMIAGLIVAVACSLIQWWLYDQSQALRDFYPVSIEGINPWVWGVALALGALGGDAVKSFFKRRVGVEPGKNWVPFDQLDFVVGTLIAISLFLDLPVRYYVIGVLLGLFLHPIVNIIGWLLRLKENPF